MAIRVVQYVPDDIKRTAAPQLTLEKHFLMRECGIQLDTQLDRQWYDHGMPVLVKIRICNRSSRVVRKIQVIFFPFFPFFFSFSLFPVTRHDWLFMILVSGK